MGKGGERMPTADINYFAVIVAAAVNMGLGAFWYSMSGFGKQWMKLSGITKEDIEKAKKAGMAKSYAIAAAGSLVMAYVLSYIVDFAQAQTIIAGVLSGLWIWLGFVATVLLGSVLWENKSWNLYAINAGYYLVSLMIMGVILAVWG